MFSEKGVGAHVRKTQDHYFKKAKQEQYPARSVYKLQEAQEKYRLLRPGDKILDLGCQPGSWSMYAARVAGPSGLVVAIDLQAGGGRQIPGGAPIHWLTMDMNAPDVLSRIREISERFDVVLSDAAPKTTGNRLADQQQSLSLAGRVLEVTAELIASGGNFYCKVFEGEDFKEYVEQVRRRFRTVRVVKPKSSRPESREVFVLGQDFRKTVDFDQSG
jgi:23S rRNA (uridine2552-2'-O)-methyltransferase